MNSLLSDITYTFGAVNLVPYEGKLQLPGITSDEQLIMLVVEYLHTALPTNCIGIVEDSLILRQLTSNTVSISCNYVSHDAFSVVSALDSTVDRLSLN